MTWTCPKCERELKNPKQWHNCVKVDIDSLFKGKANELTYVFDKILTQVIGWEAVSVSATKNCIVFVHHQTFLVIRPMQKQLDIKFYSETKPGEDEAIKSSFYSGRYENHIRISTLDDLSRELYGYIKKSYKLL